MNRADQLRAELDVIDLEERLAALKAAGGATTECKAELRYARWVHRGGPQQEADRLQRGDGFTDRAAAALYERWLAEGGD